MIRKDDIKHYEGVVDEFVAVTEGKQQQKKTRRTSLLKRAFLYVLLGI